MTGSRGPLSKDGRFLPPSGRDGPVPELPEREWRPETLVWWEGVWRSPMATQFVESDRHELARLALLVDEFMQSPSRELAAEIRMQGAAFGLSPASRKRLGWVIRDVPPDPPKRGDRLKVIDPVAAAAVD